MAYNDPADRLERDLKLAFERGEYLPGETVGVVDQADALGAKYNEMARAVRALERRGVVRAVVSGSRVVSWVVLRHGAHEHGLSRAAGHWLWSGTDRTQVGITPRGYLVKRPVTEEGLTISRAWSTVASKPSPGAREALRLGSLQLIARVAGAEPFAPSNEAAEPIVERQETGLRMTWLDALPESRLFASWRDGFTARSLILRGEGEHVRLWPARSRAPVGDGALWVRPLPPAARHVWP